MEPYNPEHTSWNILDKEGNVLQSIETTTPEVTFLDAGSPSEDADYELTYMVAQPMLEYLDMSHHEIADLLEIDPSTLSRWKKRDQELGRLRSKTLHDLDQIIAKGVRIFGSREAFKMWLTTANTALGGQQPLQLLKNPIHFSTIDNTLESLSWGTFI